MYCSTGVKRKKLKRCSVLIPETLSQSVPEERFWKQGEPTQNHSTLRPQEDLKICLLQIYRPAHLIVFSGWSHVKAFHTSTHTITINLQPCMNKIFLCHVQTEIRPSADMTIILTVTPIQVWSPYK